MVYEFELLRIVAENVRATAEVVSPIKVITSTLQETRRCDEHRAHSAFERGIPMLSPQRFEVS